MAYKSSNEEYDLKLCDKEIFVLRLEDYINARTPILHECLQGHQWKANPDNILRGKGCPHCNGKIQKTTSQYSAEIKNTGLSLLEEYINDSTPILHRCSNGHKWRARPTHILRGTRCPKCMTSGFSLSKPAILYYIKLTRCNEEYYKIGITNRTIAERFVNEKDKTIEVLLVKHFDSGSKAKKLERFILNRYKSHRANVSGFLKSSGNTELFNKDIFQ